MRAARPETSRCRPSSRGRPCLEFYYLHWGAPDQADADIEELRAACRPDVECRTTTSFAEFHHYWGPGWGRSVPRRIVWDAASVSELNEDAIDVLIDISGTLAEPGTLRMIELFDQRGALSASPQFPVHSPGHYRPPGASGPERPLKIPPWTRRTTSGCTAS